jgi:hypothetical protein
MISKRLKKRPSILFSQRDDYSVRFGTPEEDRVEFFSYRIRSRRGFGSSSLPLKEEKLRHTISSADEIGMWRHRARFQSAHGPWRGSRAAGARRPLPTVPSRGRRPRIELRRCIAEKRSGQGALAVTVGRPAFVTWIVIDRAADSGKAISQSKTMKLMKAQNMQFL